DTRYISPNDNGEGSSSGPSYSNGSGFNGYMDDSGIPLPDLPMAVKQWGAEWSHAEKQLHRRSSDDTRLGPGREEDNSITQDPDGLLPRGSSQRDLKNSWKQADDKEQDSVQQSKSWKGKGKEKEKDEPEPPTVTAPKENDSHAQQPPTPKPELPSGIDLNTDYQFIDGLAYPIIPLPKRNRKPSLSTTSQPPSTPFNNENDIAYPFPLAYPITPSPTPSFTSSTSSYRRLPPPPPPGPKPNFLSRFPFDPTNKTNLNNSNSTPPRTPTRALSLFNPQTPPPPPPPAARANTARNFTFSPPGSPYAASSTFTPSSTSYTPHPHNQNQTHLLASPSFSSSPSTTTSATGYPTPTPAPPSTSAAAGSKHSHTPLPRPQHPIPKRAFPIHGSGPRRGIVIDAAVAYLFFTIDQLFFPPQPFFFVATLLHLLAIHIYTSPFGAAAAIIAPQRDKGGCGEGEDCEKSVGAREEG
ncbi:MAG: hypothetical protein Q9180_008286, partial [Flavoplaca navasiana]